MIMMKCSNCGNEVPQGDNFCGKCGKGMSYSRPITTQVGNSLPLSWSGRVSRGIIRLTHVNQTPHGLHTIVRTIREAVEAREKMQQRVLVMTYILVGVLMVLTLIVLYFALHMH
jgi:predicted nucleic acid-binding Zn ribbon protein